MGIDEYSILRKKRKKNGFATTSLLISIALALLVLVGAVLILGRVDNKNLNAVNDDSNMTLGSKPEVTCVTLTKEMVFNNNLRNIKEAAISYFTNERLPKNIGETVKITLKDMLEDKLVLNVIDSANKLCYEDKTFVEVTKEKNEYVMKIFLSCSDMEDYIIVHLGCYDYCDSNVCEKKEEVPKNYEYEYKKTTSCTMNPWSNWGEWKLAREKTSNLKKEDTKTETVSKDTVYSYDAVADPVTYNCNKYPGYTLVEGKCVLTETVPATKTKDTYNCDKYPNYTLVDDKCVKTETVKDTKSATKNEATYSCPSGYTRSVITYTVKSGDTLATVAKANNISISALKLANKLTSDTLKVGQKLTIPVEYQNKCYKNVSKTDTKPAIGHEASKKVSYKCYESVCSTQLVPSCDSNGYCEMAEVRTCDKVSKTCKRTEKYIDYYYCEEKLLEDGYKLTSDNKCKKTYTVKEYTSATKNADTYNCDKYPDYKKSGTQCVKDVKTTDEKAATVVPGEYVCNTQDGYKKEGTQCVRVTTKTPDKNKQTYSCASDYKLTEDNKCVKTVTANSKVTYYRYATRTCTGGSTSIKWSTSKNDSILIGEGYKPTGVSREKIVK